MVSGFITNFVIRFPVRPEAFGLPISLQTSWTTEEWFLLYVEKVSRCSFETIEEGSLCYKALLLCPVTYYIIFWSNNYYSQLYVQLCYHSKQIEYHMNCIGSSIHEYCYASVLPWVDSIHYFHDECLTFLLVCFKGSTLPLRLLQNSHTVKFCNAGMSIWPVNSS